MMYAFRRMSERCFLMIRASSYCRLREESRGERLFPDFFENGAGESLQKAALLPCGYDLLKGKRQHSAGVEGEERMICCAGILERVSAWRISFGKGGGRHMCSSEIKLKHKNIIYFQWLLYNICFCCNIFLYYHLSKNITYK